MTYEHARFYEVLAGSPPSGEGPPPAALGAPYLTYCLEGGNSFGDDFARVSLTGLTEDIIDESADNHYNLAWGISPTGNKALKYYEDDTQGYIAAYTHPALVQLFEIELPGYQFDGINVGRQFAWSRDDHYVVFFRTSGAVTSAFILDVTAQQMLEITLPAAVAINAAAFSADSALLALSVTQAVPSGFFLQVYDTATLTAVVSPIEVEGLIDSFDLAVDASDNIIYSVVLDNTVYKRSAASEWATVVNTKVYTAPTFTAGPLAVALTGPAIGHIYVGVQSGSPSESARIDCLDSALNTVHSFAAGTAYNGAAVNDIGLSYNGNYLGYSHPQTGTEDVIRLYSITDFETYTLEFSRGHIAPFPTIAAQTFIGGDDQPA